MKETRFKQTEIGEIPEDWEVRSLEKIADVRDGTHDSPKQKFEGKYFVTSKNIINGRIDLSSAYKISVEDFIEINKRSKVDKWDILLSMIGTVGEPCFIEDNVDFAIKNVGLIKTGNFDLSKYIFYQLKSPLIQNQIIQNMLGSTQKYLTLGKLRELSIVIPPTKEEQKQIAKVFSDIDTLISSLEKLIEKKKNIKQGTMQQLLTGKKRLPDFAKSDKYKQTEIGEIPEDWEVKELKDLATIIMGQSPNSNCYNTQQKGLPLIQGNADIENRKTIIRFYTSEITKTANIGDIIFTVRAPVGNVAKATFNCCLGRGVAALRKASDYLYHYLIYMENDWTKTSTGSTFDSINSDNLNKTLILCPSIKAEQTAIANILSDMDNEINILNVKLEKYISIKQGMMQQLLTGKIRLI